MIIPFFNLHKQTTPFPWNLRRRAGFHTFIESKIPESNFGREVLGEDYTDKHSDNLEVREADFNYVHHAATKMPALLTAAILFEEAYSNLGQESGDVLEALHKKLIEAIKDASYVVVEEAQEKKKETSLEDAMGEITVDGVKL